MNHWPHNSTFGWSVGQWPQPLYYDTYPNVQWSHPQHYYGLLPAGSPGGNPYPGQSPGGSAKGSAMTIMSKPYSSSSTDPKLHRLLGGKRGSVALWNVAHGTSTARRISSRGTLEPIPAVLLEQPAMRPSVREMRIICDAWDTEIRIPLREPEKVVNVMDVLECTYMCLQEPVGKDEWHDKSPAVQKKIYAAMCERIRKAPPSIRADGHILRVDCLSGKTAFRGLKRVGRSGKEWQLLLGAQRS